MTKEELDLIVEIIEDFDDFDLEDKTSIYLYLLQNCPSNNSLSENDLLKAQEVASKFANGEIKFME